MAAESGASLSPEGWLDVSYPVRAGMVHWPGQPPVELSRLSEMAAGDSANVSALRLSLHTGTHMDAPRHFLEGEDYITAAPFEAMIGAVRVVHVPDVAALGVAELSACEARLGALRAGERIFFRTDNSLADWTHTSFDEAYVAVRADGARLLAERGVRVVGVDYLSVAPFTATVETHRILLGAGVWVIEGLDLRGVAEGCYDMLALPLKIVSGDASPVRVLIRPSETG